MVASGGHVPLLPPLGSGTANPFNYCPLVIVQVVRSSDNALNNFSHLFKCVVMVI